jgi:predicted aminopeptidase
MAGLASWALCASPLALAGLGGSLDSVNSDRVAMKAQLGAAQSSAAYSVQTLQLPSGTVLREYVSAGGTVFGVAWNGPAIPDLRTALGSYFPQLVSAASTLRGNHHEFAVNAADLIVQSSGQMGAFSGHAYVPSLLPQNVSPSDIQ